MQTARLHAQNGLTSPTLYFWTREGVALGEAAGYALTEQTNETSTGIGSYYTASIADSVRLKGAQGELRDASGHRGIDHVVRRNGEWWVGGNEGAEEIVRAILEAH